MDQADPYVQVRVGNGLQCSLGLTSAAEPTPLPLCPCAVASEPQLAQLPGLMGQQRMGSFVHSQHPSCLGQDWSPRATSHTASLRGAGSAQLLH